MNLSRHCFVLLAACALLGFMRSANAAIFVVDRTDDTAAPSAQACTAAANDCSLRGAIIAANANGAGADTITLPAGTYAFTLPSTHEDEAHDGDLDILGNLTLNGAGAKTTIIDGAAIDHVFEIWPAASEPTFPLSVTIADLSVTGGSGANGGGIRIDAGTIALNRLVIRDNQAESGGAVYIGTFSPLVTISRSTLTGNEATSRGGAVYVSSDFSSMTIVNSTLTANGSEDRGGAIYSSGDITDLTLNNDTITANTTGTSGGGIANDGDVTMRNTLLVENTSTTGDGPNCDGFINSNGYNIVSNTADCTGITDGTKHDHVGDDPLLDPLGLKNNGGPTRTIALLAGSPAINAGDDASCRPIDQRGLSRPQGAHCDIGAYEKGACGDGFLEPEEQCDDHNTNDGDGCSGTCIDEIPGAVCGNGTLETDEECDDGNTTNGDGCSATCATEAPGGVCGNSVVEGDEECDDGNTANGDGCSATCQNEEGGTAGGTTGGSGGGSGGCSLIR
jgi:cysteine-rich repeat protein/predicted outer membrane repeat protein